MFGLDDLPGKLIT